MAVTISRLRSPRRTTSHSTVQSTFTMLVARAAHHRATRERKSRPGASFQRASVSGKCSPISPMRRRAQERVADGVAHHVGVRVPDEPDRRVGEVHAAEHERAPGADRVHVVSDSGSNHTASPFLRIASAIRRSSRNVTLRLVRSPGTVSTGFFAAPAPAIRRRSI